MAATTTTVAGAQSVVLSHIHGALPAERLPLLDAIGKVLAADVRAPLPHPPFAAAIKDGFAVRAADGAGERQVVSASRAGAPAARRSPLAAGEAAYVTTGAPMPPGTDAVVMIEAASERPGQQAATPNSARIAFDRVPAFGEEVRAIGSDIPMGSVVLRAGDRLGAAEVGLLASMGCSTVAVICAPRVGVLSTGDELADALAQDDGESGLAASLHAPARIYDSNRPLLLAAAASVGAEAIDLGIAGDDAGALERAVDAALASGVHALVCSGGVSMGDRDLVKPLLERRGVVHFGKVRMKPGKPLTFATIARRTPAAAAEGGALPPLLVFGLPGNPVSCFACFHLLVATALRRLRGEPSPLPRRVTATLGTPMRQVSTLGSQMRTLRALDQPLASPLMTSLLSPRPAPSELPTEPPAEPPTEPPNEPGFPSVRLGSDRMTGQWRSPFAAQDPERPEYHRALLVSGPTGLIAHSTGGQISSRLLSCRGAESLVELPAAAGVLPAGTRVSAILIGALSLGSGVSRDELPTPLLPAIPAPAAAPAAAPATPPLCSLPGAAGNPTSATAGARGGVANCCFVGLLLHGADGAASDQVGPMALKGAAQPGRGAASDACTAVTASLLAALAVRLVPGSWAAHTEIAQPRSAPAAHAALARLRDAGRCSLVIALESSASVACGGGGLGAALNELPQTPVPALGSLMRSACLAQLPAEALLGTWGVSVHGEILVVLLPSHAAAALVCLEAVLGALPHAIAQIGGRVPPQLAK